MRCSDCRFYQELIGGGPGQCRKRPPRVVRVDGEYGEITVWPTVRPDAWCGEYSGKWKEKPSPNAPRPPWYDGKIGEQ